MKRFSEWLQLREAELAAGSSRRLPDLPDAQWWGAPGGTGGKSYRGDPIGVKRKRRRRRRR